MRPPKPTPKELLLRRENDGLKTTICCLRRELTNKEAYAAKLELVLHQRLETIDALPGKLKQSQKQIRRLDQEAERLADMIRIMPQLEAMLAPK